MSIEFLPNAKASCKAVLAEAEERIDDAKSVLVCWLDEDGSYHWSTNTTSMEAVWLAENIKLTAIGRD